MYKKSLTNLFLSAGLVAIASCCGQKQSSNKEVVVAPGAMAIEYAPDDHGSMEEEMRHRMDEREHRMMEHVHRLMDERSEQMMHMVRDGVEERMDHFRENAHRMGDEIRRHITERDEHIQRAFEEIFGQMERFHHEIERMHHAIHEVEMRWEERAEEFGHDLMGTLEDRNRGIEEAFEEIFSTIEMLHHKLEGDHSWDEKDEWDEWDEEGDWDEAEEAIMGFDFDIQIDSDDPEMAGLAEGLREQIQAMVMEQMMRMRGGDDGKGDRADRRDRKDRDKAERDSNRNRKDRRDGRRDSEME